MPQTVIRILALVAFAVLAAGWPAAARAEGQGVVAVVNDRPITEFDITQRIALLKILGDARDNMTRKMALQSLIDDEVKAAELKKLKMTPSKADVTAQVERVSKGMNTTVSELTARLKKQGIGESAFQSYISTQMGFSRLIAGKHRNDIKITPEDVDRKHAEVKNEINSKLNAIMNDPRMRPVTVYTLTEITLPVESDDPSLLQSRAVEAGLLAQRIKGCGNIRQAAEGIYNVKVGKKIEADATRLPKPLKAALDKAGPGRAVGPMRVKNGIQLLAFCGSRKVSPERPKGQIPTREQVEAMLINQKYDGLEEDYLKTARKSVYIEYRNGGPSQ